MVPALCYALLGSGGSDDGAPAAELATARAADVLWLRGLIGHRRAIAAPYLDALDEALAGLIEAKGDGDLAAWLAGTARAQPTLLMAHRVVAPHVALLVRLRAVLAVEHYEPALIAAARVDPALRRGLAIAMERRLRALDRIVAGCPEDCDYSASVFAEVPDVHRAVVAARSLVLHYGTQPAAPSASLALHCLDRIETFDLALTAWAAEARRLNESLLLRRCLETDDVVGHVRAARKVFLALCGSAPPALADSLEALLPGSVASYAACLASLRAVTATRDRALHQRGNLRAREVFHVLDFLLSAGQCAIDAALSALLADFDAAQRVGDIAVAHDAFLARARRACLVDVEPAVRAVRFCFVFAWPQRDFCLLTPFSRYIAS